MKEMKFQQVTMACLKKMLEYVQMCFHVVKKLMVCFALRSMAPKVIAVDEIGGQDDTKAIEEIMNCGVKIICTAHGSSVEEIMKNPDIKRLLDKKVFEDF